MAKHPDDPDWREAIEVRFRYYLRHFQPPPPPPPTRQPEALFGGGGQGGGGGATGRWERRRVDTASSGDSQGGGGDFGGGGATGSWDAPSVESGSVGAGRDVVSAGHVAITEHPNWRHVSRNGYDYQIDDHGRTRQVSGSLILVPPRPRSRSMQRSAGGTDRLPKDDGGHYVAPRFNGPTEAFNHFAQDENVNRGRYRVMEDEWAREKRAGHQVTVTIVPHFRAASRRPKAIDVEYWVDGELRSVKLPNERGGSHHGR